MNAGIRKAGRIFMSLTTIFMRNRKYWHFSTSKEYLFYPAGYPSYFSCPFINNLIFSFNSVNYYS